MTLAKKLYNFPYFNESLLLTVGTVLNSILGLIFYAWIARLLGVANFGTVSYLLGLAILAGDIGDMGMSAGIIRYGHGEQFRDVFTIAAIQRLLIGGLFFLGAIIASRFSEVDYFSAAVAGFSLLLFSLISQSFLAKQKYLHFASVNLLGNVVRIVLLLLIISRVILTSSSAVLLFSISNLVAFIISFALLVYLEKGVPFRFENLVGTFRLTGKFNGLMGSSFGIAAISGKIDGLMVFSLVGPLGAGIYASAQRLSSIVPQIAGALDGLFSVKLSKAEKFSSDFKHYLVISIVGSLILLTLIPFTGIAINLIFTEKYYQAVPILQIIMLGLIGFLLSGPYYSAVVFYYGKSQINFYVSILILMLSIFSLFILIPPFGVMGAAIVFVVVNWIRLAVFFISYDHYHSHPSSK